MYDKKLAFAIKVNGKILREFGDTVYIPFGSEYSILIKNLNTVKVGVSITIDGNDVLDGSRIIVDSNSESEVTRSIRNNNLTEGNRFKFIERTSGIEEHRGINIDDGLIVIQYEYAKPSKFPTWESLPNRGFIPGYLTKGISNHSAYSGMDNYGAATKSAGERIRACSSSIIGAAADSAPGITVAGSISTQQFTSVAFDGDGTINSMVIKLVGTTNEGKQVLAPVTVAIKPKCTTCGTVNKATNKFCSNCGTSLQIV